MSWVRRCSAGVLALAVTAVACSSGGGEGTGGAGGEAGGAGGQGGEGGAGGAWTLDNYCERFAPRWCAALRPCCEETSGLAYDADGCIERWTREVCEPLVDAVRKGRLAFALEAYSQVAADAEIDDCIALWEDHFGRCQSADFYDYLSFVEATNARCNAFAGKASQNEPCLETVDCQKTFAEGFVFCAAISGEAKTCQSFYAVTEGLCVHGSQPCLEGAHCDAPITSHEIGSCVPNTPLGMPCEPDPLNPECGVGAHCDLGSAVCVASKGSLGDLCVSGLVNTCQSGFCAEGRCTHPLLWDEALPERIGSPDGRICTGEPNP